MAADRYLNKSWKLRAEGSHLDLQTVSRKTKLGMHCSFFSKLATIIISPANQHPCTFPDNTKLGIDYSTSRVYGKISIIQIITLLSIAIYMYTNIKYIAKMVKPTTESEIK